jgi:hypothetical protein
MKTSVTFLFLLFSLQVLSQDVIQQRNGETIKAKVLEISSDEVKYKKHESPDGPTYVAKKSDLLSITYENGQEDLFKTENSGKKKMYIWEPSTEIIELPKLNFPQTISLIITDNRKSPPEKSIVEFTSSELIDLLCKILKKQSGTEINISTSKELAGLDSYVLVSIEAYDATFYPGIWHTQTRYFVQIVKNGEKKQKEIESLKGAYNTFGYGTAKGRLTKSFEEGTFRLIEYINSEL